jgi:hypothetical protein
LPLDEDFKRLIILTSIDKIKNPFYDIDIEAIYARAFVPVKPFQSGANVIKLSLSVIYEFS